MYSYTVTFATLNCLDHTKKCINSLLASGVPEERIVAVDNNSNDGTPEYLNQLNLGSVILNRQNLSCGNAWNQGILANQSEWTIVMNNDIVVAPGFVERLIDYAILNQLKIVSPARIDGTNDYDFIHFAENAQLKTAKVVRLACSNAICMCIHWSVFMQIGFFASNPNLLGFEDGIFYNEIRKNKIKHATTGSVWIHHFGSVTQDHLKMVLGIDTRDILVKNNDRRIYGQSWLERKTYRYKLKQSHRVWRKLELLEYGMTLHGIRNKNIFTWL